MEICGGKVLALLDIILHHSACGSAVPADLALLTTLSSITYGH
jgi:hypothetical protein